jgi:hypothetical protein
VPVAAALWVSFSAGMLKITYRAAFIIAGARVMPCLLRGRHSQGYMAYGLARKMLHATTTRRQVQSSRQNTDSELVPFQLGRRPRNWRVQQHRPFTNRHCLRSGTRQLWSHTSRATGPASPRHRPNDRCRLLEPLLPLHPNTRTIHRGSY